MAISEDTAALVAAQLTQAWAALFAQKEGAEGLRREDMQARVWQVYDAFKGSVTEVPITGKAYDINKLT